MNKDIKHVIPEIKYKAVENALESVFSTTEIEDICLLHGGLSSALVYKITVKQRAYVLKIIMDVHQTGTADPVREHTCMLIASDAGVTPKVYYADTENAVTISDFVRSVPTTTGFVSREAMFAKMAEMVKNIHATPLFPKFINFLDGIDQMIAYFKNSKILPEYVTKEHFKYYAQIRRYYPGYDESSIVSSHNDLNPRNILFDGEKLWPIDWGAAFQNDRYADLAIIANFFSLQRAEEENYLSHYFSELDEYKKARFFLMRQCCYVYYSMVFFNIAAATKGESIVHDTTMDTIPLRDFQRQLGEGKITLALFEEKMMYAKILLNEMMTNAKTARFEQSINVVRSSPKM